MPHRVPEPLKTFMIFLQQEIKKKKKSLGTSCASRVLEIVAISEKKNFYGNARMAVVCSDNEDCSNEDEVI